MKFFNKGLRINILLLVTFLTTTSSSIAALNLKSKEINVLLPAPFADSTKELVKEFNEVNKNRIKIKVTRGPRETESVSDLAISSLILGKSPFDIVLIDITWLPKYVEADWLYPLDKWITTDSWNQLAEGAKKGNRYKQKIYRWPFTADIGLLYYRKDLIKSPPRHTDELMKIATNLVKEEKVKYGYVWQGRQYEGLSCVFLEIVNGFGGEWIDTNNNVGLGKPKSIKAASWLRELISSGASPFAVTNFSENEALQSFESGEAAMMRNWPYAWSELQKENSPVKGKVAITTMVSDKKNKPISTLGSWGFSILKTSNKPNKSFEVIKFFTSKPTQRRLFIERGYTPTSKELFTEKRLLKINPMLPKIKEALNIAKPRPENPLYSQFSDVLQRNLSEILTNKIDISTGMHKAEKNTQQIISSAGLVK